VQLETRRLLHIKGRDITFSTVNPSPNSLADGDILFVNSKGRSRNLRLYAKHLRKLWYVPLINVSNANLTGDLVDTESIQTMMNKSFLGKVGIGVSAPAVPLHVVGADATTLAVLELEQNDDGEPFIEFDATSASDQTKSITSVTSVGALRGHVRVAINESDYWMPFYATS
jgi:hypothetical protein